MQVRWFSNILKPLRHLQTNDPAVFSQIWLHPDLLSKHSSISRGDKKPDKRKKHFLFASSGPEIQSSKVSSLIQPWPITQATVSFQSKKNMLPPKKGQSGWAWQPQRLWLIRNPRHLCISFFRVFNHISRKGASRTLFNQLRRWSPRRRLTTDKLRNFSTCN